ncbi:MAG: iron-siderophore ABC transporter substrate-binding protein [Mycobacteriaceae bacterium]|uniref:iron-siderophore ABC transporter substrate-binding protein n=1 Tax=Corynebacterium sp. TaxID=1720 RepID=UPI003F9B2418
MKTTLMRVTAAAAALATGIALSACSSDDDGDGGDSGANAADGTFPATVETKFGEETIEEAPQRVVALGWGDAEIALDLGVQPVGASDWLGFGGDGVSPWNDDTYDEAPEILATEDVEYEKIAALDPDLILNVRSDGEEETYDQLSDIAPTVSVPEGADSFTTTWDTQVEMISEALGVPEEGDSLVSEVNGRIDEVKEAHPDWADKTASVVTQYGEGWGAYPAGDARMDLILALGFKENQEVAELDDGNFYVELSEENIDVTDSDVVLGFPIGLSNEEFESARAWNRIGAVEDGRGIVVDEELTSAFSLGTPDAMLAAIDELEPQLAEAAEAS